MVLIFLFAYIDYKKKRKLKELPYVSFVVPCFNDSESVSETIYSIYNSYERSKIELIVTNDKSTDNSLEILKDLQKKFGFRLIENEKNIWKVQTLNTSVPFTTNDLVFVLDADVIVNKKAIYDVISRFQANDRIWWVSCPYIPNNKWFLPLMQSIEYNMLKIIQWSYNIFSAIALWWWCLAFKKEAFFQVWKFSVNAIIEDMDLAFKLNKAWWKVEQSFCSIKTFVPDDIQSWYKQKIRRNSGGLQCFVKYIDVWIRNPLHILIIFLFNTLIFLAAYSFFVSLIDFYIDLQWIKTFQWMLHVLYLLHWDGILLWLIWKLWFTILSLPYVIPLIKKYQDIRKVLYVIPFSLIYTPMFSLLWIIGTIVWIYRYRKLKPWVRAW